MKKEKLELEKFINYFKWIIVTLAVSTVTLIVSNLFKERDQDLKELEYFDKYVTVVKQENLLARVQLAKYLAIVAPNGDMKTSWTNYHDSLKKEYKEYSVARENIKNDTLINKTPEQIKEIEESQRKVELLETPLINSNNSSTELYIIAGANKTFEGAKDKLNNALAINPNSTIIKKGNQYRIVLRGYSSRIEADAQINLIKKTVNSGAYIVTKNSWCNKVIPTEKCLVCQ
ncbi:SPOR domain-containing protein [Flavobacterium sp. FlaQc-50]|uniref:SPOR domain-containing protein n=1 Tax=unclassified Flavobacterium TaxID=196869 RepID=UPI0037584555